VVAEFGSELTWAVLLPLYCKIYREKGYWVDWYDEDSKLLFSQDECKVKVSAMNELVAGCIRRSLFDKEVFDAFGVLTSDRIQENYLIAKARLKEVSFIEDFAVKNSKGVYVHTLFDNVYIIELNVNIICKNVDSGTQNENKKKKKSEIAGQTPHSKLTFETREKDFYDSLKPYLATYGADMLRKFYDYWREPNKIRSKMKWERENTWDLSLRLQRWASNDFLKKGETKQTVPAGTKLSDAVKQIENGEN